jgi:hypothetical protein
MDLAVNLILNLVVYDRIDIGVYSKVDRFMGRFQAHGCRVGLG